LLQQVLEAVQLRGHRTVCRITRLGDVVLEAVRTQSHGGERISQLMRGIGDESPLTVQGGPHHLSHRVERRSEVAQFGWTRHVCGRPGDPFGHLGGCALQPIERTQHPSGQRPCDHRGEDEQAQTADRHPQPAGGDFAGCDAGVDRHDDGADQFPIVAYAVGGQPVASVPRQDTGPSRRRCVDEGVVDGHRDVAIGDIQSARRQSSTVRIGDQQAFAIHLEIAIDQTLQRGVGHSGGIRQCGKLPVSFRGECCGSAVRQTERQRNCECGDRQQR
jgi:hypothetical protein